MKLLSDCCGMPPVGEVDVLAPDKPGVCSLCHDNVSFTEEGKVPIGEAIPEAGYGGSFLREWFVPAMPEKLDPLFEMQLERMNEFADAIIEEYPRRLSLFGEMI